MSIVSTNSRHTISVYWHKELVSGYSTSTDLRKSCIYPSGFKYTVLGHAPPLLQ
uniref:Harpin-induced protein n=1 Tax=Solanum tuberosum TaxID=4113 RepID=M1CX09_SOLTU